MDIIIIANFCGDFQRSDNNRFQYLASFLGKDHEVELLTSDFLHSTKKHRAPHSAPQFRVTMVHEPGYPRNICLRRFYSHWEFGRNVKKYLDSRKKPDVIYCAVPSLDAAKAAAEYAGRNRVPFVLDIQDLWPEAFKMVFRIPVISDLIFLPMKKTADAIYRSADLVISVSDTYAQRADQVNKTAEKAVVYLGTDRTMVDSCVQETRSEHDGIEVAYIGSLEKSYDLENVIRAVSLCRGIRLVIMGEGSKRESLQKLAQEQGIACEFTGRLPYPEMVARLCQCDIAVNPIKRGSAGSVINKVGDYAMAGLPVVNTQECEEYRNLLVRYQAGLNCRCEDARDMADKLQLLADDPELRYRMARNARTLGEEKFDRSKTYQSICDLLEKI